VGGKYLKTVCGQSFPLNTSNAFRCNILQTYGLLIVNRIVTV
jgi:hypothetical protein